MTSLVFAVAATMACWLGIAAMLIGLGFGLILLLRLGQSPVQPLVTAFWLGFAVVICLLQCWHFIFRIGPLPWALSSLLAIPGLWKSRQHLAKVFAGAAEHRTALALTVLAALWTADRSIGPSLGTDAGVYGVPAIKWFINYPVVPGLGNLQERLGFNNSIFLFDAMLDQGFWRERSHHLENGLLVTALLLQVIWSNVRLLRSEHPESISCLYEAILLIPAFHLATDQGPFFNIASATTDPAVSIMMFVGSSRLLRILVGASCNPALDAFFVAVLLTAAVTIKLNAIAFTAAAWILVCWSLATRAPLPGLWRSVALSVCAAVVLIIPWMGRGVILSGYPFYPLTIGAAKVDWRVPEAVALETRRFIRDFARHYYDPEHYASSKDWVRPWILGAFELYRAEILYPVGLTLLGLIFWISLRIRGDPAACISRSGWLAAVPALASLIQTFAMAPSPRFTFASFWMLAALTLAEGLGPVVLRSAVIRKAAILVIFILAGFMVGWQAIHLYIRRHPAEAVSMLFNMPGPDSGFHPLPKAHFVPFVTRSGLTVLVPTDKLAWSGPLLSTPEPDAGLELRVPGQVRYGFRVSSTPISATSQ